MQNIEHFKKLLEKELETVEKELKTVGRVSDTNQADWEATRPVGGATAEEGDLAEGIQGYDNNIAIVDQLETQLNDVKTALLKIEKGEYGVCEVCHQPIEEDRLEASPTAKTCKEHMNG